MHSSAPAAPAPAVECEADRLFVSAETAVAAPRTINIWRFSVLAYFLVCGGPFGIEIAVTAGGPLATLVGFALMPLLWSLPQALMTAEMSSLISDNGGYVVWAQAAFGDLAGWLSGVNGSLANVLDLALYPALVAEYMGQFVTLSSGASFGVRCAVVVVCYLMNLRGLEVVTSFLAVITLLVMAPFFIYFFYESKDVFGGNGFHLFEGLSKPDWGLFISTIMWSYTGWDSLGCIAGEVKDPARTFVRGSLLTIVLVTLTYAIPVLTCVQLHPNFDEWDDSSFLTYVKLDMGKVFGGWVTSASILSNFGIFHGGLSASSRAVWALAGGDATSIMPVRHIPAIFGTSWKRYNSPVASLTLHVVVVMALNLVDFEALVEADMLLTGIRLYLEFASFLWLRRKWSHVPRTYAVPGGWAGAVAITIPKVALITWLCVTADWSTWRVALITNAIALAIFGVRKKFTQHYEYDHSVLDAGPGTHQHTEGAGDGLPSQSPAGSASGVGTGTGSASSAAVVDKGVGTVVGVDTSHLLSQPQRKEGYGAVGSDVRTHSPTGSPRQRYDVTTSPSAGVPDRQGLITGDAEVDVGEVDLVSDADFTQRHVAVARFDVDSRSPRKK